MKKLLTFLMVITTLLFVGCDSKKSSKENSSTLKVGVVLGVGGLGDKSFNDAVYQGLVSAKKDLGIEYKYSEPNSSAEDEQFLREYAEAKYDLIIATGFPMKDAAERVAKDYPDMKFAMIDEVVDSPNTRNLLFKEDEGSFLMGALAGMMSKTGTVGFVGGLEIPLIQKFQRGYEQGAKYINPNMRVLTVYIGGLSPFSDPLRGKEIALSLIQNGSDVVYHAAGGSGLGVIEGTKEAGKYAIGVDSDQDDVAPGVVLTSMLKKVDVAVYDTIKSVIEGDFTGGIHSFGIAEDGVGTTDFRNSKEIVGAENIGKIQEIISKIKSGEIVVQ